MIETVAPVTREELRAVEAQPAGWTRWFKPTLVDVFFIALTLWLFNASPVGWSSLLSDGDTGWHIRVGEWVLEHGTVPKQDLFSFTKAGESWFAWEWLCDVIFAGIHGMWGLKGLVYFSGILIVCSIVILLRWMAWRGSLFLIAMPLALMCVGVSSIHYLARPHVFTLLLLPVAMWLLDADRRRPTPWVWMLIPLTALWTNLHGGFMAWIACVGLVFGGYLIEAIWAWSQQDPINLPALKRYGVLAAGCAGATLVNPYGYHLHEHIAKYLQSKFIHEVVQEFQSPSFRSETMLQLEVLLFLGLIAVGLTLAGRQKPDWVAILWLGFWAHQCLHAVRHATVYVLVATPLIAAVLSERAQGLTANLPRKSVARILVSLAEDVAARFRGITLWPVAFLVVYGFLAPPLVRWPSDFPTEKFPVSLMHEHKELLATNRVLTSDQWADYLIYQSYPRQRVFIDGRSDFYGERLGREYLKLMTGQDGWESVREKYRFRVALIPGDWALLPQLKRSSEWKLIAEDRKVKGREAYLFVRQIPEPGGER